MVSLSCQPPSLCQGSFPDTHFRLRRPWSPGELFVNQFCTAVRRAHDLLMVKRLQPSIVDFVLCQSMNISTGVLEYHQLGADTLHNITAITAHLTDSGALTSSPVPHALLFLKVLCPNLCWYNPASSTRKHVLSRCFFFPNQCVLHACPEDFLRMW